MKRLLALSLLAGLSSRTEKPLSKKRSSHDHPHGRDEKNPGA
jgi:hypothetical protein